MDGFVSVRRGRDICNEELFKFGVVYDVVLVYSLVFTAVDVG